MRVLDERCVKREGALAGAVLLALFLWVPPPANAQEKPRAALGRVATLGDVSDVQQRILATRIEATLAEHYRLVPEEEYLAAEEAAFQELEAEQCTEANCVRLIQEFLQVERLFILQVIRDEGFTQLSVALFLADEKRLAEDICTDCDIQQLYTVAEALTRRLIEEDLRRVAERPVAPPPPRPEVEPEPEPIVEEEPAEIEPETPSDPGWALWAGGAALLGGGLLMAQAQADVDDAEAQASQSRKDNDTAQFDDAESKLESAEQLGVIGTSAAIAGIALLIYYFAADSADEVAAGSAAGPPLRFQIDPGQVSLVYSARW